MVTVKVTIDVIRAQATVIAGNEADPDILVV